MTATLRKYKWRIGFVIAIALVFVGWLIISADEQPAQVGTVEYLEPGEEMPELGDMLGNSVDTQPVPSQPDSPIEEYPPQDAVPLPYPADPGQGPDVVTCTLEYYEVPKYKGDPCVSNPDRVMCPAVYYPNPTAEQRKNNPCIPPKSDTECPEGEWAYDKAQKSDDLCYVANPLIEKDGSDDDSQPALGFRVDE